MPSFWPKIIVPELIEADGVDGDIVLIIETFGYPDVGYRQPQRRIGVGEHRYSLFDVDRALRAAGGHTAESDGPEDCFHSVINV
jgi:hypothetical protein